MNTSSFAGINRLSREAGETPLRIVVLYSDKASADKVTEVYGRLVRQLREITRAEGMWWSMDLLKDEETFHKALRTARQAKLLFVAVRANGELPHEVRDWLERAVSNCAAEERAIAALLGMDDSNASWQSNANDYLQKLAGEAGIEYYSLWYYVPPTVEAVAAELRQDHPTGTAQSLEKLLRVESEPHGGINE